jgi:hypothetical protein
MALCDLTAAVATPAAPPCRSDPLSLVSFLPDTISTKNASLLCCWRLCCPDAPPYQRGAARQKNAISPTTAPSWTPEVAALAAARFDPPLTTAGHWAPSGQIGKAAAAAPRREGMYFVVEIKPNGTETFLEGFEDAVDAYNVANMLQLRAKKYGRKVRYDVR